jgi:hypothetical protein
MKVKNMIIMMQKMHLLKVQHPLLTKAINKFLIEGKYLNTVKANMTNPQLKSHLVGKS